VDCALNNISEFRRIAVIGAGLVGTGWAIIFATAGLDVRIFDANPKRRHAVKADISDALFAMQEQGLLDSNWIKYLERITVHEQIEDALTGADYVQESVHESLDLKLSVYQEIDRYIGPDTIVGSSSSGIPASKFTEALHNRQRIFIVHPVNPPHLIPLVEIVPAPWSAVGHIPRIRGFMESIGQKPITLNREIEGFILNRLQGALLNEAWALFSEGYASCKDIDRTVSQGLACRWSLMGPFETIDLNAEHGIGDYAARLGPLYYNIAKSRSDPQPWSDKAIEQATAQRRTALPIEKLIERRSWRDAELIALKQYFQGRGKAD
jgi:L-gulonate 3-dehydrogenase